MRIDYSEPKKSYVTTQGSARPRKEPTGFFRTILVVAGVILFISRIRNRLVPVAEIGQEVLSGRNRTKQPGKLAKKGSSPATKACTTGSAGTATHNPSPILLQHSSRRQPPALSAEPPLSFYKTLPSGQKGNVLGSGINTKDDKTKQPLQAPIPTNMTKPPAAEPQKTADKPAVTEKAAATANTGFTVQVASYALKSEAETLKNSLAGKGYNAFISESHQGDKGTWYRVRVGRKMEQEAAKELARKLGKSAQVFPDKE